VRQCTISLRYLRKVTALVKRHSRCTSVATYCTDWRILTRYVVLIKYFWLIIYREILFCVYRNKFLKRYSDLNRTILITIARRYINGLHFHICRPINFHSEVPERVPMHGKHDGTKGLPLLLRCYVPLRICFIRTSPKRFSIEVTTCYSVRSSLWAGGLGEYMGA